MVLKDVFLEEYILVDNNLIVASNSTDDKILDRLKLDDENTDPPLDKKEDLEEIVPPTTTEYIPNINQYLLTKDSATDDVYRAFTIFENFLDNELLKQKQTKIRLF